MDHQLQARVDEIHGIINISKSYNFDNLEKINEILITIIQTNTKGIDQIILKTWHYFGTDIHSFIKENHSNFVTQNQQEFQSLLIVILSFLHLICNSSDEPPEKILKEYNVKIIRLLEIISNLIGESKNDIGIEFFPLFNSSLEILYYPQINNKIKERFRGLLIVDKLINILIYDEQKETDKQIILIFYYLYKKDKEMIISKFKKFKIESCLKNIEKFPKKPEVIIKKIKSYFSNEKEKLEVESDNDSESYDESDSKSFEEYDNESYGSSHKDSFTDDSYTDDSYTDDSHTNDSDTDSYSDESTSSSKKRCIIC